MLQCVAVCYSVLRCVAVYCIVLIKSNAFDSSVLQSVVVQSVVVALHRKCLLKSVHIHVYFKTFIHIYITMCILNTFFTMPVCASI